jgi:glycine/D-amino acid oxidase-like deaminating enzyme
MFGVRQLQPARGVLHERTSDPAVVADLAAGFRSRFPSLRDVPLDRTWGGWIAMTSSWLPVAGEATPNVLYAIGCNGHGLAQARYLGTLLADRLGGTEAHDDLNAVWRERPRLAPAPLFTRPALRTILAVDRLSDRFCGAADLRSDPDRRLS